MSGLSSRRSYIAFTDAMAEAMSPQRHIDRLATPLVVPYGTFETPEYRHQSRDHRCVGDPAPDPRSGMNSNARREGRV